MHKDEVLRYIFQCYKICQKIFYQCLHSLIISLTLIIFVACSSSSPSDDGTSVGSLVADIPTSPTSTSFPLTPTPTSTPTPTVIPTATDIPPPTDTSSPAEGFIAFLSNRDGNSEFYIMNPDGSSQQNLNSLFKFLPGVTDYRPSRPVWSPDQQSIAFISQNNGNDDLYVIGIGKHKRVTESPGREGSPIWSSDSTRIIFTSERDGSLEIYVTNLDGSGQINLTNSPADDAYPTWSPDNQHIAFSSRRDGDSEIYVMNADGSDQINLTNNPENLDYKPIWSPDGKHIAFISWYYGEEEIYGMDTNDGSQANLTHHPSTYITLTWSPDSSRIAFVSSRDDPGCSLSPGGVMSVGCNTEIYVMNADGSNQTNLTNNPATDLTPTWSPDGKYIAFTSNRDGNKEIYVMNADGSSQTNLTNNPANDFDPSWSPR